MKATHHQARVNQCADVVSFSWVGKEMLELALYGVEVTRAAIKEVRAWVAMYVSKGVVGGRGRGGGAKQSIHYFQILH